MLRVGLQSPSSLAVQSLQATFARFGKKKKTRPPDPYPAAWASKEQGEVITFACKEWAVEPPAPRPLYLHLTGKAESTTSPPLITICLLIEFILLQTSSQLSTVPFSVRRWEEKKPNTLIYNQVSHLMSVAAPSPTFTKIKIRALGMILRRLRNPGSQITLHKLPSRRRTMGGKLGSFNDHVLHLTGAIPLTTGVKNQARLHFTTAFSATETSVTVTVVKSRTPCITRPTTPAPRIPAGQYLVR